MLLAEGLAGEAVLCSPSVRQLPAAAAGLSSHAFALLAKDLAPATVARGMKQANVALPQTAARQAPLQQAAGGGGQATSMAANRAAGSGADGRASRQGIAAGHCSAEKQAAADSRQLELSRR